MLGAAAGRERELWAGVNCWRFSALSILSPAMDYSALNLDSVAALEAPRPHGQSQYHRPLYRASCFVSKSGEKPLPAFLEITKIC